MLKFFFDQIPGLLIGLAVGGGVTATSAKVFGWFNKQIKSVETKINPVAR